MTAYKATYDALEEIRAEYLKGDTTMCMKHHYDRNRKAVQQGLDRRKEEAREAAQDAAGQALQAELRKSNQRREAEKAAAEAAVCRHVAQVVEETNREMEQQKAQLHQEQHRRDRKALAAEQLKTCLVLTFCPLVMAAGAIRCFELGMLPIWLSIPGSFILCTISVWNYVAYATRNWKWEEVNHHA